MADAPIAASSAAVHAAKTIIIGWPDTSTRTAAASGIMTSGFDAAKTARSALRFSAAIHHAANAPANPKGSTAKIMQSAAGANAPLATSPAARARASRFGVAPCVRS